MLYGAAVTLFVLFFVSLTVYVGKWAVGLDGASLDVERAEAGIPVYLRPGVLRLAELLTKDSPYAVQGEWVWLDRDGKETTDSTRGIRQIYKSEPVNKEAYAANKSRILVVQHPAPASSASG